MVDFGDVPFAIPTERLTEIANDAYQCLIGRIAELVGKEASANKVLDHSTAMSMVASHLIPAIYAALRDNSKMGSECAYSWLVALLSDIQLCFKKEKVRLDFNVCVNEEEP